MESAAKRECAAWRARDGGRTQVVFSVWDLYEMVRVQLFERDPRTLAVRLLGQLVRTPPPPPPPRGLPWWRRLSHSSFVCRFGDSDIR